jgi:hypothetical protein
LSELVKDLVWPDFKVGTEGIIGSLPYGRGEVLSTKE